MLIKTPLGEAELRPGQRTLGLRERAILLLADGTRTSEMLGGLYGGAASLLVNRLLEQGYIVSKAAHRPIQASKQEDAPPLFDPFAIQRPSLGEARLYLFDLSERLLAPRDKSLATAFREELRMAKDEEALVAVAHKLLETVAEHATPERISGMAEKLQRFFPETRMLHPNLNGV